MKLLSICAIKSRIIAIANNFRSSSMKHILSAIFLAIAIGSDRGLSISDPRPEIVRRIIC
jgi:hypothetical protein